jgi:hypothetical protein
MIFGKPGRPKVCVGFQPSNELCGETAENAMEYLLFLEKETKPDICAVKC